MHFLNNNLTNISIRRDANAINAFCERAKKSYSCKTIRSIFIVILLICTSIFISGCYSYREISKEDYVKKESHNKSKIILKDKKEILIDELQNSEISSEGDYIIIKKDTSTIKISYSEINKIMEKKYDVVASMFSFLWLSLLGAFVLSVLFLLLVGSMKMS